MQYILVNPSQLKRGATFSVWAAVKAGVFVSVVAAMLFSAYVAYRWVDTNLLHWGVHTTSVTETNTTELVAKLQAFEVVTIKHQYDAATKITVHKGLDAGPLSTGLPGWIAGQELKVDGEVLVAAGIDLSALRPEDITMNDAADGREVVVHVPAPQVTSTEIVGGSLDMDTSRGILTRVRTNIGLSERDLRDEAGDSIAAAARSKAINDGLLTEASSEAKTRLEGFLNSLPKADGDNVVYRIEVASPSLE
jgi:hypothetical protein